MDRHEFYGIELTPTDRMTLAWLIITGKHKCARKIRRMRLIGSYDQTEMDAWTNKLRRIKKLEKTLEGLP